MSDLKLTKMPCINFKALVTSIKIINYLILKNEFFMNIIQLILIFSQKKSESESTKIHVIQ